MIYAAISVQGIGTIWDCSNILYFAIDSDRPFVYTQRYTDALFGWIVILMHRFTDDVRLLAACFAFAHLAVTLLAWILCGYLLRTSTDTQRLIAALMILAVPLPGQAYVCTDVNHVAVMVPVLIALAVSDMTRARCALFVVIAGACFLDHPGSLLVFGLLAMVMGTRWMLDHGVRQVSPYRVALLITVVLLVASVARFSSGLTAYEKHEMEWSTTVLHFRLAVYGLTGISIVCVYVAAATALVGQVASAHTAQTAWRRLAIFALLVGSACMLTWASDPFRWIHAETYRKFVIPLNVMLGALMAGAAGLEARAVTGFRRAERHHLLTAGVLIALLTHGGCLLIQSTKYSHMRSRLRNELVQASSGITFLTENHWTFLTPLRIWALPYNSILLQGRQPVTIATFAAPSDTVYDPLHHTIRFGDIAIVNIASVNWFKFDRLLPIDGAALRSRSAGGR